jgi:hypothetical protein
MVGSAEVMIGQLDRLVTVLSLPRVKLGIYPSGAEYMAPTNQFIMFDDRMVYVETVTAELAISQPREISLYAKSFQQLSSGALYGQSAGRLISRAASYLRNDSDGAR